MHIPIRNVLLLSLCVLLSSNSLTAQTSETAGWFFLSHSQKLAKKWSYTTDVQLRSSPGFKFFQNILIRPGLLYHITEKQSVGMGYTYFATWDHNETPRTFEPENRIFEQYTLELEFGRLKLNNRFRLEQRFIQQTDEHVFAQRFRHQVQAKIRLNADTAFKKGLYLNLQNEIFLNIQNKEKLNDNFFDQNRPYAGIGYRFTKKIETELGYYHRYQLEKDSRKREPIVQFMLITNL